LFPVFTKICSLFVFLQPLYLSYIRTYRNFHVVLCTDFLTHTEAILSSERGEYRHFSSTDSDCFQDYQIQLQIENIRLFTINSDNSFFYKCGLCFTYIGTGVHILEYEGTKVTCKVCGNIKQITFSHFLLSCILPPLVFVLFFFYLLCVIMCIIWFSYIKIAEFFC
jgi:hypothetical protein